ncbi:MAG: 3-oxoacyl-[acyl-carrier-protein] synthase III C-terminal domain-containing protein [Myxococcota bacterium]
MCACSAYGAARLEPRIREPWGEAPSKRIRPIPGANGTLGLQRNVTSAGSARSLRGGVHIASVGTALPKHSYDQEELLAAFMRVWGTQHHNPARVEQLHRAVQVGGRHLALPMEAYEELRGFGDANRAFIEVATEVGEAAVRNALDQAGLGPKDVDAIYFTTVTGVAAPSIDARLVNRLGLRPDVKRLPLFGLGCVAGVAGTARVFDYLRAWPDQVALLLSVELCSLTLQRADLSIPNLIASGLFGDGSAALVATGAQRATQGPRVLATQSRFYPNTEQVMGWDIGDSGFKIVLSADVPAMVDRHLRADVDAFLNAHGLDRSNIGTWVCHTGGPKVLAAFETSLELPDGALERSWTSLREVGNLSSASVLFVLADTLANAHPAPGSYGMMIAMGPGFCSEMVLLQW